MKPTSINKRVQREFNILNKPVTRAEFVKYLEARGACGEAVIYVQGFKSPKDAWDKCERYDWMEWLMTYLNERDQDEIMGHAADTLYEAYPTYEGWGSLPRDWEDTAHVNERKMLKKMAKEIRLFLPWSHIEKRIRLNL
jgi:hypothetical protein